MKAMLAEKMNSSFKHKTVIAFFTFFILEYDARASYLLIFFFFLYRFLFVFFDIE